MQRLTPDHPSAAELSPGRSRHATRQGEAISGVLADIPGFRSAQDIHAELRRRGHRVGLTTVYRHLNLLAEQGAVDVLPVARKARFHDVSHTVEIFGTCDKCARSRGEARRAAAALK